MDRAARPPWWPAPLASFDDQRAAFWLRLASYLPCLGFVIEGNGGIPRQLASFGEKFFCRALPRRSSPHLSVIGLNSASLSRTNKEHCQVIGRCHVTKKKSRLGVIPRSSRGQAGGGTLSLIHISEPTRQAEISYAVFCLKKK